MNEMYDMSIVTHYYGVIGILLVILANIIFLKRAKNIPDYKRQMSLFTPIGSTAISAVIFTGVIMMAAKHLDFTMENIVMIAFSIWIIYLEVLRAKGLKYVNGETENALENFKSYALILLMAELFLTLSVSFWMLY